MNKLKLASILLLFATQALASEGYSAFTLCRSCDPVVVEYSKTGIISAVESSGTGLVEFTFSQNQPDQYYEIRVFHDDGQTFNTEIRSRSVGGFTLKITQGGNEFDPSVLVTVAIDR